MTHPLPTADPRRTRRALASLVGRHAAGFVWAIVALVAGASLSVATPLLLGEVVDAVTGAAADALPPLFLGLSIVAVALAACTAWSRLTVSRVGERMLARLREEVVERVVHLPSPRVEAAGRGEVIARVTGDVSIVGDTVSKVLPGAAASAFTIAAAAIGLGAIDLRLTLAALIAVPLQIVALRLYLRRSQPVYRAARAAAGERSQRILEALDARDTLVAFGAAAAAERRIDAAARETAHLAMRATRLGARFWGRLNLAEFLGLGAILVVGWVLVVTGDGTVGAATAAALLFMQLFGPIGALLAGFDDLQLAGASLARLVGVLDEPPMPTRDAIVEVEASIADAAVALRSVTFAYDDHTVLHAVDLTIRPGGHVAVVGASGAGKSTLAALVSGDLVASSGSVVFARAHPSVGLVGQENHVFSGPLRDDLSFAHPGAGDDELQDALRAVGAWEWVERLADGVDTAVGSGGERLTDVQRQQLALARMHLRDPDILILDEATSEGVGEDGALEAAAARLAQGRTTITIAHRLDQASLADEVVVLDGGRLVERGTHHDLLARDGEYASLWRAWRAGRARLTLRDRSCASKMDPCLPPTDPDFGSTRDSRFLSPS